MLQRCKQIIYFFFRSFWSVSHYRCSEYGHLLELLLRYIKNKFVLRRLSTVTRGEKRVEKRGSTRVVTLFGDKKIWKEETGIWRSEGLVTCLTHELSSIEHEILTEIGSAM